MSQALLLRVNALESRVQALESRLKALEPPAEGFEAYHRGFGRWRVRSADGTDIGTEPMTKDEAEAMAAEMNEITEPMSA